MNLILLFDDDFTDDGKRVRLRDRRHVHVRRVLRASPGDELCVGVCGGRIGTGRITALDDDVLEMDVTLERDAPVPLPVTLALALPRPIMLQRVLASVSSMGVKRVHLFHSNRVEKSFWKSPVLKPENLRKHLVAGLEQARDTILPEVVLHPLFKPFVEDRLGALAEDTRKLVAHPGAPEAAPRDLKEPATFVMGPEGGFVPYEMEKLAELGFEPIQLGERVLRVETAVPYALARLFG